MMNLDMEKRSGYYEVEVIAMRKSILDILSKLTDEEKQILSAKPLDMSRYNHTGEAVVEPGKVLPNGELFGMRTHTRFTDFPQHGHEFVEMVYQVTGETTHIIGGIHELVLKAGQILFLGRGAEHAIKAAGEGDIAVNFFLIPAFFNNAAISIGGNSALAVFLMGNLSNSKLQSGYLVFDIHESAMIENLLENLILGQIDQTDAILQQLTLELLIQHLSRMSQRVVIQNQLDYEQSIVFGILSRIETKMRMNLSEEARNLQMDVTTLSRLIRKYTGCSFTELLHTARFNRAIKMLRDSDVSVTDIANAVGYENTAFFYRRFTQRYGCTPMEYRMKHRK